MGAILRFGGKFTVLAVALAFLGGWAAPVADLSYAQVEQGLGLPPVSTDLTGPSAPAAPPAAKPAPAAKGNKTAKSQKQASPAHPAEASMSVGPSGTESLALPSTSRRSYTGKPISLDLLDADLRNVLRLLSDLTGTNIVIEPEVTGRVTLKVEQVPWDQVLDMILTMNDLGKEQVGNVIRIAKQGKLRQEWTQQAESIKVKQDLVETSKDLGDLATVYLSVSFAKPAEIAAKLTEAKSERGKVAVDERTSLIIYTDYPARIANARSLLTRLDRATPQVLIEARIVTLDSTSTKSLGFNFGSATTPGLAISSKKGASSSTYEVNGPSGANLFHTNIAEMVGSSLVQLDLRLSALETANSARIVASPRVMTLDNVKAVISQGVQIPYLMVGTDQSNPNVFGTQFKDAVLELQVTPHITPDRKVRLTIEAKQDTPGQLFGVGLGTAQVPGIDTRKISTELLVDDANIIVIGGVLQNTDSVTTNKTPGLADIPLLGRIFKSEQSTVEKRELLIFISPRIVEVSTPSETS